MTKVLSLQSWKKSQEIFKTDRSCWATSAIKDPFKLKECRKSLNKLIERL